MCLFHWDYLTQLLLTVENCNWQWASMLYTNSVRHEWIQDVEWYTCRVYANKYLCMKFVVSSEGQDFWGWNNCQLLNFELPCKPGGTTTWFTHVYTYIRLNKFILHSTHHHPSPLVSSLVPRIAFQLDLPFTHHPLSIPMPLGWAPGLQMPCEWRKCMFSLLSSPLPLHSQGCRSLGCCSNGSPFKGKRKGSGKCTLPCYLP